MLPNFLVAGAQKSVSTSLHEYLRAHDNVYLPDQKETKFFLRDEIYANGIGYYEEEFFGDWNGQLAVGEIDPDYMYFKRCLPRISENLDLNQLKVIFVPRNPVDRAFSHYLMTFRRGLEDLTFEEALVAEPSWLRQDNYGRMHYSYYDRGLYTAQVERFMELMDPKRMLFLLSEDLASQPEQEVAKCLEFLEVQPTENSAIVDQKFHRATVPRNTTFLQWIINDGWHKQLIRFLLPNEEFRLGLRAKILSWNERPGTDLSMPSALRAELMSKYRSDILSLQELTGLKLEHWLAQTNDQHERPD